MNMKCLSEERRGKLKSFPVRKNQNRDQIFFAWERNGVFTFWKIKAGKIP